MARYFRVFSFMFQVWGMIGKNKTLLQPILYNIALATPLYAALAFMVTLVTSEAGVYAIMAAGVTALYFIDYVCAGLTASLIHDQVTQGDAKMSAAVARVKKATNGILIFAAISAALDLLSSYAQERDDVLGKIITSILYAVWTTATFMVMPAMIIEELSFGRAFARSKDVMSNDPTNVGVGVVGIATANYVLGGVIFGVAYKVLGALAGSHPVIGVFSFFAIVNVYWALSGYLKISYYTCFYLWVQRCERERRADPELAPQPLAAVLAG